LSFVRRREEVEENLLIRLSGIEPEDALGYGRPDCAFNRAREAGGRPYRKQNLFFRGRVCHVTTQPRDKAVEANLVGCVESLDEDIGFLCVCSETRTVDGEEGIRNGERRGFVAIQKGMIL
jgi:hypothetical protein